MSKYAKSTNVSVARTRMEIEETVTRYGATSFVAGWQGEVANVMFEMEGRRVKFTLTLPDKHAPEFTHTTHRRPQERSSDAALKAWEQACRQRWRALLLVVKAKLEAVESGITTFDNEFLAHLVIPGQGGTVGELIQKNPALLNEGRLPKLLGS